LLRLFCFKGFYARIKVYKISYCSVVR
jgi:hypothetical protein